MKTSRFRLNKPSRFSTVHAGVVGDAMASARNEVRAFDLPPEIREALEQTIVSSSFAYAAIREWAIAGGEEDQASPEAIAATVDWASRAILREAVRRLAMAAFLSSACEHGNPWQRCPSHDCTHAAPRSSWPEQDTVSLDTLIGHAELGELLAADDTDLPWGSPGPEARHNAIERVLASLDAREQRILRLRFGLDDGRGRTLEEVGTEFGWTREQVRQVEVHALRKLRQPSRSRDLRDLGA